MTRHKEFRKRHQHNAPEAILSEILRIYAGMIALPACGLGVAFAMHHMAGLPGLIIGAVFAVYVTAWCIPLYLKELKRIEQNQR